MALAISNPYNFGLDVICSSQGMKGFIVKVWELFFILRDFYETSPFEITSETPALSA